MKEKKVGYRSEVAYVIRFANKEMRELFVSMQRAKADKHINEALNELVEVEDCLLGYHADHVKWYDGYDGVKAHETLMQDSIDMFNQDEDIVGWRFVRLGEESDDNVQEEDGNSDELYEYVDWHKSMSLSFERNTYEQNQTEGETE
jgi:hypothetical protein